MNKRGFSLIELVIVLVVMSIIAGIAVVRMAGASERSKASSAAANVHVLQSAVELYMAEHDGRDPATLPDGSIDEEGDRFRDRLLGLLSDEGEIEPRAYLRESPLNPWTKQACFRVERTNGRPQNTCGWIYLLKDRTIRDDSGSLLKAGSLSALPLDLLSESEVLAEATAVE